MTIIPNQFFGIGDIIFCQTLVNRIADGRPIVWPVMPHFVEGLQRAYPHIQFVDYRQFQIDYDRKDQYEFEHPTLGRCTVLPLRWSDVRLGVTYDRCMRAKYDMYGMNFEDWREGAMWVRSKEKENIDVYQDRDNDWRGFPIPEKYTLLNRTFGSDGKLKVSLQPDYSIPPIEMRIFDGVSLFDWAAIIENATEIHTVNTSIIYLLELLDLKAPEIHLYQRPIKGQTFETIDYILKRHKYVFHG